MPYTLRGGCCVLAHPVRDACVLMLQQRRHHFPRFHSQCDHVATLRSSQITLHSECYVHLLELGTTVVQVVIISADLAHV